PGGAGFRFELQPGEGQDFFRAHAGFVLGGVSISQTAHAPERDSVRWFLPRGNPGEQGPSAGDEIFPRLVARLSGFAVGPTSLPNSPRKILLPYAPRSLSSTVPSPPR